MFTLPMPTNFNGLTFRKEMKDAGFHPNIGFSADTDGNLSFDLAVTDAPRIIELLEQHDGSETPPPMDILATVTELKSTVEAQQNLLSSQQSMIDTLIIDSLSGEVL